MIPILYEAKETRFVTNGLGVLVDAGYCTVTEERNGEFELELQYPINGSHYADIGLDRIILAKPNTDGEPQAFRIYHVSKPMSGVVTVRAEHISYQLSNIVVMPFKSATPSGLLQSIKDNSVGDNPFSFWTDKIGEREFDYTTPQSARSLLGGSVGSALDLFGGEFEFDNFSVKLHSARGYDNGVVIAYAKNLTGVKCDERVDGIVNGVIPYWQSQDENGNVDTVVGDFQYKETSLSFSRNVSLDCSADFTEKPTKEQLNDRAVAYLEYSRNAPYVSVSVEFVNLGDTEEYKQYKNLEKVSLCDVVTVRHPLYGIDVKAKVVKTVFDSINEKYEKIEIGEARTNISQTISVQSSEIKRKPNSQQMENAIRNANWWISNGQQGEIVLIKDENGRLKEIVSLDTGDKETARSVWRFNNGGFGHSSNGYEGDYTLALLADGSINADMITTGHLNADILKSGRITSNDGNSYFDLSSGSIVIGDGDYRTIISLGSIKQFLNSLGGNVGGIVPAGSGQEAQQTIYYDAENIKNNKVAISAREEDGSITNIVEVQKDKVLIGLVDQYGQKKNIFSITGGQVLINSNLHVLGHLSSSEMPID